MRRRAVQTIGDEQTVSGTKGRRHSSCLAMSVRPTGKDGKIGRKRKASYRSEGTEGSRSEGKNEGTNGLWTLAEREAFRHMGVWRPLESKRLSVVF